MRQYLEAGADVVSTNSFTATRIAQADYGLSDVAREINEAAARLAREAADEAEARDGRPRYVGGSVGPTNRTASISPDVNDPAARNVTFPGARRGVPRVRRGPDRRRRGHPARRDDLRHAQREGRDRRAGGGVRGDRRPAAARHLRDDHRRQRPHAQRPDGRGVLGEHPPREAAARRPQLRARREAAPRARRGARPDRGPAARGVPQRRAAQRARRLRRDATGHRDGARRVGAGRPHQRRGVVLRVHARAHARDRGCGRGHPAAGHPRGPAGHAPVRPRAARDPDARRRLRQHRRAHERHRARASSRA